MSDVAATYAVHPLANLIPRMTDGEYAELVEDISANGQLQPILIFDHMVLDGRHRLRACEEIGLVPRIETYTGDEPAAHVLSLNLRRRHLSTSQRAMIATDFLPHLEEEAAKRRVDLGRAAAMRQHHGDDGGSAPGGTHPPSEADRAAGRAGQMVGVSRNSVDRAKRIARDAPDLVPAVRAGELTVSGADTIVKERAVKKLDLDTGRVSARSVQRIAQMGSALLAPVEYLNLTKSCARLTEDERAESLRACKEGLKALNALANALGR